VIISGPDAPIEDGNALPLSKIPLGTTVHNVELTPSRRSDCPAAGASAQVVAKEGDYVTAAFWRSPIDASIATPQLDKLVT